MTKTMKIVKTVKVIKPRTVKPKKTKSIPIPIGNFPYRAIIDGVVKFAGYLQYGPKTYDEHLLQLDREREIKQIEFVKEMEQGKRDFSASIYPSDKSKRIWYDSNCKCWKR